MANYNFKVDLKGIIRLLSDNLYSSPDVFLRELLQNAVDAIRARKQLEPDFKDGKITVSYHEKKDYAELIFRDNGVGLTKEEIHSFLSVIGQSSKRSEEVRSSFIGQFGIGLLSCFLVTEQIKVISRSVKEEKAYQWIGHSDGTYRVTEKKEAVEAGSAIHILLKGRMYRQYGEEKIIQKLYEYGFLITTPMYYESEVWSKRINDAFIPWRQQFSTREEIMQFGEHLFHEEFFDVIPLTGEEIRGYAFISMRQMTPASVNQHKIFLKNMFITEDGKELIPKWAFFTKCIVNAEDLTPTASRESFSKDYKLMKAKNEIEKCIFDYFVTLSQYDVRKLKQITMIHNVAIKSLAVENEQIYKLFFPFLTFTTNKGSLTGFQILDAVKKMPVHYCVEVDDYRRISPLLEGSSSLLINAGYIYDARLLQMIGKFNKGIKLDAFDESSYENLLETPPEEVQMQMVVFMSAAVEALQDCKCGAVLKSFSPQQLPAIYVPSADSLLENTLGEGGYSSFFEGFSFDEEEQDFGAKLYINCNNSLIQRLAAAKDMEMIQTIVQVIYVQAFMAGHYSMGEKEMAIMNKSLTKLMEYGLGGLEA